LAGTSMAGKPAGNSGSAVHPYGCCRIRLPADLETAVEDVPRPRQWLNHKTGGNAVVSHRR
jgi:hypothetical protein